MSTYYTIGMAGHIDHGKTTLTKALTGVQTDRLKEEQERKISIELGFAPLFREEDLYVSIIDVPGHERFVRQMIAGVAGIDLFMLVIAANEGFMPQTKEHLEILTLLGIRDGIIVFTKVDQVDEELFEIVKEDVQEQLQQFELTDLPIYEVDSVSGKGISALKEGLRKKLTAISKPQDLTAFRLPIDQVFTIKGQGTIVRGTVYNGTAKEGEELIVLPSKKTVRIRQIQSHNERQVIARQGQRVALNLGGISWDELKRGDVLVTSDYFSVSRRFDVVLYPLKNMNYPLRQRQTIKVHIGTSEVMGRIIFFDRNEINQQTDEREIYCQIELEEEVVLSRGDRFIIRRPSPAETVGGGVVIEAVAERHRFGAKTAKQIKMKKDGTPKERIQAILNKHIVLSKDDLQRYAALSEEELKENESFLYKVEQELYTSTQIFGRVKTKIVEQISAYHEQYPMRRGLNKAEIFSNFHNCPESLLDLAIETLKEENKVDVYNQFVSLYGVKPTLPSSWEKRLTEIEQKLIAQRIEVDYWDQLFKDTNIPSEIKQDFYHYLIDGKRAFVFDEGRLISAEAVRHAKEKLKKELPKENFSLQEAREVLELTRKNLIPLLELFDELGITTRVENERKWLT